MASHRAGQATAERVHRAVGFAGLRLNARQRDECLNETIFTSLSKRRACRFIEADRKSVRYRSTRDDDGALGEKLRDLAMRDELLAGRDRSAVAIPASCSIKIAMICSSLNLLRFIVRLRK